MSSALELCQAAAVELSLVRPTSVGTSSTDPTAQKLARHLQRTCRDLAGRYDWQILRREHTFTTSGAAEQSNAVPDDFLRFVKETMFNRTRRTRVCGPLTPAEWQNIQANFTTTVYDQFIQRGNAILMAGQLAANETVAFEYITKSVGLDANSDEVATFGADTDVPFFDDELVITGIVWRYRKSAGGDYSEEFREHEMRFANMVKMDGGRRKLDMSGPSDATRNLSPPVGGPYVIEDLSSL